MKPSCLFVGFGQLASMVNAELAGSLVSGVLKKSPLKQNLDGIAEVALGDASNPQTWQQLEADYELVLFCVSPTGRSVEQYRKVYLEGLIQCVQHSNARNQAPHIVFVSSSSVYGQDDDSVIDERSEAVGASDTSKVLVEAENVLKNSGFAHTIVRFSGIYGGQRTRLLRQVEGKEVVLSSELRRSNRIHEVDAVNFLVFLIRRLIQGDPVESVYLVTDNQPVDLNEVYAFIAKKLGVKLNEELASTSAARRTGNKQLSNQRISELGFSLQYPTYREGYEQMCREYLERPEE